jgi:3-oxoacyl-[acyl-carrier protein] reductase
MRRSGQRALPYEARGQQVSKKGWFSCGSRVEKEGHVEISGCFERRRTLHSKVAVVTGGARGIGLEIGRTLAQAGARVALADINGELLDESTRRLCDAGYQAIACTSDVSEEAQVQVMVGQVLDEWNQIDILVNNAGICPLTAVEDITSAEWDLVLGVNLKGAFLCSQAVIPTMRRQGSGKIINIASNAGQMGGLASGAHYSASKAGLLGLTKSLARNLAPIIQVNAVAPGPTESEMTSEWDHSTIERLVQQVPAGRLGRPADVADAVLFLASDEASFITGQTLSVNGGLLMV